MVLRDSLVYIAEDVRFQVVNVARPREPVLVGSCVIEGAGVDMALRDSIALVAALNLRVINVARPDSPVVVGNWYGEVDGVDIADTIAYVTAPYTGFVALSVADPVHPYVLDSLHLTDTLWWNDVVVVDTLAYVGGERIWVVDVSNPRDLRLVPGASWTPPYLVRRLLYEAPYLYAACYDAGVCVLETISTGVAEPPRAGSFHTDLEIVPSITTAEALVYASEAYGSATVRLFDVLGREYKGLLSAPVVGGDRCGWKLKLAGLPAGVYVVSMEVAGKVHTSRVLRTTRR
jgi:hypothetical protein